MLLDRNPAVAEMLLVLQPIISRYELQRIYRRGFAYKGQGHGGLFECTEIVSRFASRTAFSESVFDVFPQPIDDHYYTLVQMNTNEDAIQSAANNPPIIPSPQYIAPEFAARETYNGIVSTIDDRRYLFHAVDNGVIGAVNYFLMRNALCLDAHTYADAFSRAWDSGDPFNLCLPRVGALWPRSSAARWLVLEKLVKEEDEVFTVFALQTAFATMAAAGNGVGDGVGGAFAGFGEVGEEVIDSILHCMRVCFAIIEDEWNFCEQGALSDYSHKKKFSGFRDLTISRTCDALLAAGILHEVVGIAENEGNPDNHKCDGPWSIDNVYESVFKGRRNNHPSLWSNKTPFAQRAFDGFVAFGSVRMVALIMYKYAEHITVKPYHLTAALDRSSLPLVYFLIQYVGANPSWEEDPRLFEYLRKPGDPSIFGGPTPSSDGLDNAGRACWAWALEHGVSLTERRWSSILKLGPMTVSAVIDYFGVQSFDPCMYNMAGFCHASLPVFRALSRAVDAKYSETSKCVLWEAAYGDQAALSYVTRLGEILLQDLKLGDHERAMELLHAGAIVLDDVMLAVAAIADLPPGDWEDWTIAARCYRRVLAQQRLCLPIPSRKTLEMLPKTVVNVSFLTALYSTRPIHCNPLAANVYSLYQRQRHHNTAGVRINLVPVLERDVAARVVAAAMEQLRELLKMCNDPSYPGESYCFIKGMLQYGLRDKNLLRDEDEFFLPDDEWSDVANSLTSELTELEVVRWTGSGVCGETILLGVAICFVPGEMATRSRDLLAAIKAHMTSESAQAKYSGLMLEIVHPDSPLFKTSTHQQPPAHVFLSYSGHYFRDSKFAIAPSGVQDGSTMVEVVDFGNYDDVLAATTRLLATELLTVHKPKIVFCLGKQTHSAKLAHAFELEYINASDFAGITKVGKADAPGLVDLLKEAVQNSKNTRGILIDGFPRTMQDAQDFEARVEPATAVLNFNPGFQTNNSVSAIKRRLYGGQDSVLEVPRPLAQFFGARVIPVDVVAGSEDDVFRNACRRLADARIFERDQNIVVAVGNGKHGAEANLLCAQLSKAHNLALVRLGGALGQSEALVEALAKTQAQLAQSRRRVAQLDSAVQAFSAANAPTATAAAASDPVASEINALNGRVSALQLEKEAQMNNKNDLAQQHQFVKKALQQSEDQHAADKKLLLQEKEMWQREIAELTKQLSNLQDADKSLAAHTAMMQSALEEAVRDCESLLQKNRSLDIELSKTNAIHTELSVNHETVDTDFVELQRKYFVTDSELQNRTVFFEAQIGKLKSEVVTARKNKEAAITTMMEIQNQAVSLNDKIVEMELVTQNLSYQLARAAEKYKTSKAKELEDEVSRLEQAAASLTAETRVLKSLLKPSNDRDNVPGSVRQMRSNNHLQGSWMPK
ncbi:hypothetical protein HDU82_006697 [Entophlyctis luteolus]|nr:hypothetical protein HDU82_006697 [Entophlyctis luteolus]